MYPYAMKTSDVLNSLHLVGATDPVLDIKAGYAAGVLDYKEARARGDITATSTANEIERVFDRIGNRTFIGKSDAFKEGWRSAVVSLVMNPPPPEGPFATPASQLQAATAGSGAFPTWGYFALAGGVLVGLKLLWPRK